MSKIKLLFIRSGNNGIDPISTRQGMSFKSSRIEVYYYDIIGKGIIGYLQNLSQLRKTVKTINVDLIHAHYSFSGFLAVFTFTGKPIITSLMGSDVKSNRKYRILVYLFSYLFWKKTIVKSKDMQIQLGLKKVEIIPNGVDLSIFNEMDMNIAREMLGFDSKEKIVLFGADPIRIEKNYALAEKAINMVGLNLRTIFLKGIESDQVNYFYNAADVVLLTSQWEGSPNVVKEAMACNRPVVTTDVGDVSWLIGDTQGCFVTSHDPIEIAIKVRYCLEQYSKSQGRERIKTLKLDSDSISDRLIEIYRKVLF